MQTRDEIKPGEADARIKTVIEQVEGTFTILRTELGKQAKGKGQREQIGGVLAPFEERLESEKQLWADRLAAVADSGSLDEAATEKALRKIATDVQNAATGPGLADSISLMAVSAVRPAYKEAELLVADLEETLAATDKKLLGSGKQTPNDARKLLEKYIKDLADPTVKTYMAVSAADLVEKIEEMKTSLGDQGMAKMREQVASMATAVETIKTAAEDAETQFATVEAAAKTVRTALGNDLFEKAPEFKKSLEGRLASLERDGAFEGGHKIALAAIGALQKEVKAMLAGPQNALGVPAELADGEEKAVAAKREAEIEKKKWVNELAVLSRQLDAMKGNATEIAGLKTTLAEAKKAAEANGDYAIGREHLAGIRGRAQLVGANPNGLAITSRKKLPQVNVRWRKAHASFLAGLAEVKKGIDELTLDKGAKAAAKKALTEIRCLFSPAAFDTTVGVMTSDKPDNERSASREVGLRETRRMLAYMKSDYRLRELMNTPFSAGMRSVLSEMNLSLLDMENNMLVSL